MRVLIAGSTGFIGSALTDALKEEEHEVIPLVRRPPRPGEARWDPETGEIDAAALEGADIAVNLAGESITGRWTAAKKQGIRDSRINGTKLVANTLTGLNARPKVFLCASAIGIYGDRGHEELTDSSPPGAGFLAETGKEWEEAANQASEAGIRVVNLRFGIVLDKDGGALKKMLTPFRLGFGGMLGSGRQY